MQSVFATIDLHFGRMHFSFAALNIFPASSTNIFVSFISLVFFLSYLVIGVRRDVSVGQKSRSVTTSLPGGDD